MKIIYLLRKYNNQLIHVIISNIDNVKLAIETKFSSFASGKVFCIIYSVVFVVRE